MQFGHYYIFETISNFFLPLKTRKKCSQKLLIIGPNFFFSIINRPKTSRNLRYFSYKSPTARLLFNDFVPDLTPCFDFWVKVYDWSVPKPTGGGCIVLGPKMSILFVCLYHTKCQRRGVGGQKKAKYCQRSLWTTPYSFCAAVFTLHIYKNNSVKNNAVSS